MTDNILPLLKPRKLRGKRTKPGTTFLIRLDVETADSVRREARDLSKKLGSRVTYPEWISHAVKVVLKHAKAKS